MTAAARLGALFPGGPPLVAVVHLPPSPGYPSFPGLDAALAAVRADVTALAAGGVDGVLLENDSDKPHTLTVSKAQVAWLTRACLAAREAAPLPLGVGVQRIDWEASLAVAAAAALDFVRLDVFVDRVRMQGETVEVSPAAVCELRAALRAERVQLFTDIQVKHADLLGDAPIEWSAREAAARGADAVVVTGARTGEPPAVDDLRRARAAAAPVPVLVGSGLDAANAAALAPHADGVLVGTALKLGDRIDPERVRRVVEAWRSACASRR